MPATTERDNFTDTLGSVYAENRIQWANKFRSVLALRGDDEKFVVTSLTRPIWLLCPAANTTVNAANSGSATKFLPSPKASLIFGPWANTEFYLQGGFGFHSTMGAAQRNRWNRFPRTILTRYAQLENYLPWSKPKAGRSACAQWPFPHLQSTLALWVLRSNSELMQDGDTGGTSASEQSSNRYGLEWANYYTPAEHWAFDFDLADSSAQFTQIDADDAAPNSAGGKLVPEAVEVVISSGITLHDYKGLSSSLRLRYFGPRDLTFRRNLSFKSNGAAQWGSRISNQKEMARFGRILEYA